MKKILSASICAIAMAAAVPAFAATDAKPMHHKHHMMMKKDHMMGPHTKMKPKGDPSTDELNAKSLDAARGGSTPDAAPAGTMSGPAPAAPMTPPSSGMSGTTAPSNAPGGGQ